jgi:hypothetical protein
MRPSLNLERPRPGDIGWSDDRASPLLSDDLPRSARAAGTALVATFVAESTEARTTPTAGSVDNTRDRYERSQRRSVSVLRPHRPNPRAGDPGRRVAGYRVHSDDARVMSAIDGVKMVTSFNEAIKAQDSGPRTPTRSPISSPSSPTGSSCRPTSARSCVVRVRRRVGNRRDGMRPVLEPDQLTVPGPPHHTTRLVVPHLLPASVNVAATVR